MGFGSRSRSEVRARYGVGESDVYHGGRGSDARIWFLRESSELVSWASLWRV